MAKNKNVEQISEDQQNVVARFKRKAALVLPTYTTKNLPVGGTVYLKAMGNLYSKPDIDQKTGEQKLDKRGQPANLYLLQVTDMISGEMGEMVVSVVVQHALERYETVEGRTFEMKKLSEEANKATKWEVYEIE